MPHPEGFVTVGLKVDTGLGDDDGDDDDDDADVDVCDVRMLHPLLGPGSFQNLDDTAQDGVILFCLLEISGVFGVISGVIGGVPGVIDGVSSVIDGGVIDGVPGLIATEPMQVFVRGP